jgi:hypothetical protein
MFAEDEYEWISRVGLWTAAALEAAAQYYSLANLEVISMFFDE